MCNRFVIEYPEKIHLWTKQMLEWEWKTLVAYYNAAPSQRVPTVLPGKKSTGEGPKGKLISWGLQIGGTGQRYMNARKEKAFTSNIWKTAVQARRCAIVADGFFEWPPEPAPKTPYLFRRIGAQPFSFAGLHFPGATEDDDAVVLLTTEANGATASIGHPRSPVMLDESNLAEWIREGPMSEDELNRLTLPYPAEKMEMFRVSRRMNSSQFQDPAAVKPLTAEEATLEDQAGSAPRTKIAAVEKSDGTQLNLF